MNSGSKEFPLVLRNPKTKPLQAITTKQKAKSQWNGFMTNDSKFKSLSEVTFEVMSEEAVRGLLVRFIEATGLRDGATEKSQLMEKLLEDWVRCWLCLHSVYEL